MHSRDKYNIKMCLLTSEIASLKAWQEGTKREKIKFNVSCKHLQNNISKKHTHKHRLHLFLTQVFFLIRSIEIVIICNNIIGMCLQFWQKRSHLAKIGQRWWLLCWECVRHQLTKGEQKAAEIYETLSSSISRHSFKRAKKLVGIEYARIKPWS